MTIDKTTTAVRAYAQERKQRLLADADHLLLALRDGRTVAALSSGDLALLLRVARTAAAGYGADAMAVVVEGIFPLVDANPLTGQAWQRGDAEQLWLEHNGAEKGWVAETQILAVAHRTGETSDEGRPFHMVEGSVTWGDEPLPLLGTGLAEAVAARMGGKVLEASRVPDPGDGFVGDPENGPFYDAEYGRIALDIGCTRILGNQLIGHGGAWLIVRSAEQADYLVGEGLPSWQVEVSDLVMGED